MNKFIFILFFLMSLMPVIIVAQSSIDFDGHRETQMQIDNLKEYLELNQWVVSISGMIITGLLIVIGWLVRGMIFELKAVGLRQDEKIEELKKISEIESKKLALLEQKVNFLELKAR